MEALLHKSQILDEPVQVNLGGDAARIEGQQSGGLWSWDHRFGLELFLSQLITTTLVQARLD